MSTFFTPVLKRNAFLAASTLFALIGLVVLLWPEGRVVKQFRELEEVGVIALGKVKAKFTQDYVSYESPTNSQLPGRTAGAISSFQAGARIARIMSGDTGPGSGATINHIYFLTVEFKTRTGQTTTSALPIRKAFYGGIQNGTEVPVLYHPANPAEISRIKSMSEPYIDPSGLRGIAAMFFFAIAMLMLVHAKPWRTLEGDETAPTETPQTERLSRIVAGARQRPSAGPAVATASPRPHRAGGSSSPRPARRFGQAAR